jgi:hypothetical protein
MQRRPGSEQTEAEPPGWCHMKVRQAEGQ